MSYLTVKCGQFCEPPIVFCVTIPSCIVSGALGSNICQLFARAAQSKMTVVRSCLSACSITETVKRNLTNVGINSLRQKKLYKFNIDSYQSVPELFYFIYSRTYILYVSRNLCRHNMTANVDSLCECPVRCGKKLKSSSDYVDLGRKKSKRDCGGAYGEVCQSLRLAGGWCHAVGFALVPLVGMWLQPVRRYFDI